MKPEITIVTSTYNRAEILRGAIESVRAQSFSGWEMAIVGDCTPDHTAEVIASYQDDRLLFYNLPEKSPPGSHGAIAKNYALQNMAKGRYVAYLDDDDHYRFNYLEVMLGYMRQHEEEKFAYCRAAYYDKTSGRRIAGNPFQRWLHNYSREKLERYNFIDTDCVVHRLDLLKEVGYWDPSFYFDDYELWLRISARYPLHYVNRVLVNKYVEEPPFFKRLVEKGRQILTTGRHTPLE